MNKKPRKARLRLTARKSVGILLMVVAAAIPFAALAAAVVHELNADIGFAEALGHAYNDGGHAMIVSAATPEDPAYDKEGRLFPDFKATRCEAAAVALQRFENTWVQVNDFRGQTVRDHSLAVGLGVVAISSAYTQSCITRSDFDRAIARYRDAEMRDEQASGFVRRLPLGVGKDDKGVTRTIASRTHANYERMLSAEHIDVQLCVANRLRGHEAATSDEAVKSCARS